MFGDLKRHEFDLKSTMLRHVMRLSPLTLAVVWLYLWLVSTDTEVIDSGLRHWVDRKERLDLFIFRI
jgi:hypothetical protein